MRQRQIPFSQCGWWPTLSSLTFATLSLLALPAVSSAEEPQPPAKPKMLMLTQSKGWLHQSVDRKDELLSPAEIAMKKLAADSGLFEIDFSQDAVAHFTKENLQNYDIVTLYTSGDLPIGDDDLDYFLSEWIQQRGHGVIGFHSSSDTFKEHEPFWDFIGGSFNGHPWTQNTTVTFSVHEPDHPTMKPFGSELEIKEEIYQYYHWQPKKVRVLMSIDMAKTKLKRPYHVPVAWVKEIGEGRMYYNNLGHRPDTWKNEKFLKSIEGAVRWLQHEVDGESEPNPDVSAEQDRLSKEASHAVGITAETLEKERREKETLERAKQERQKREQEKAKSDK